MKPIVFLGFFLVLSHFGICQSDLWIDKFSPDSAYIPMTWYHPDANEDIRFISKLTNSLGGELDVTQSFLGDFGYGHSTIFKSYSPFSSGSYFVKYAGLSKGIVTLTWDGKDNDANSINYTGLGNVNISGNGSRQKFTFGFFQAYTTSSFVFDVSITLYSASDKISKLTKRIFLDPNSLVTLDSGTQFLNANPEFFFSDFVSINNNGADFSKIGAIVLSIDGLAQTDNYYWITNFRATNHCNTLCVPIIAKTIKP
jgi:hypothetical protein